VESKVSDIDLEIGKIVKRVLRPESDQCTHSPNLS